MKIKKNPDKQKTFSFFPDLTLWEDPGLGWARVGILVNPVPFFQPGVQPKCYTLGF